MKISSKEKYGSHSKKSAETVGSVNLHRFAGKWYEIAAFPAWFEMGCRCSTAEYVHMDEYVEVRNTCSKDGQISVTTGKAYPVPSTGNAQLRVRFVWPFKSDYWIIALDDEYRYAMVGHPGKKYLWIMSRTPHMEESVYQSLVEKALSQGYEVTRLRRTDQSCAV